MVADAIMATLHQANSFFEFSRPWELKLKQKPLKSVSGEEEHRCQTAPIVRSQCDEDLLRLETIIAMTMDVLRVCGIALQPLLPQLTEKLLDKLNVPVKERQWNYVHQHFVEIFKGNREPGLEVNLRSINAVLFKRLMPPKEAEDDGLAAMVVSQHMDESMYKGQQSQKTTQESSHRKQQQRNVQELSQLSEVEEEETSITDGDNKNGNVKGKQIAQKN